jgi:pimeloyl-ACP methyl ester carboxylesterase
VASDLHGLIRQLGYERYSVVGYDIGMWIGYLFWAIKGGGGGSLGIVTKVALSH